MNERDTFDAAFDAVCTAIRRVAPEADFSQVTPGASLRVELDLDSLDFLAVVENLAILTGVSIPEDDYAEVDELDRLVRYVAARAPDLRHTVA